jgi:Flp pilus assembly protein TadD
VKFQHAFLMFAAASPFALMGCSQDRETIAAQSQRNWVEADPAALASAKPEPDAAIKPNTYLAAGRLHEMQGSLNKAVGQYQLALAGDPKNVGAMNRLAMVYTRMGRYQDAQRTFKRAVELNPNAPLLRNNLGYAYICTRSWREAEHELREALRLDPRFKRARINLGLAVARQERIDEALAEFRTVLPEPDALYNLGLVLRGMQRYQEAADAFSLVLEHDQSFVAAQQQLDELAPRLKSSAIRDARAADAQTVAATARDEPRAVVVAAIHDLDRGQDVEPNALPGYTEAAMSDRHAAVADPSETEVAVIDRSIDQDLGVPDQTRGAITDTVAQGADVNTPALWDVAPPADALGNEGFGGADEADQPMAADPMGTREGGMITEHPPTEESTTSDANPRPIEDRGFDLAPLVAARSRVVRYQELVPVEDNAYFAFLLGKLDRSNP